MKRKYTTHWKYRLAISNFSSILSKKIPSETNRCTHRSSFNSQLHFLQYTLRNYTINLSNFLIARNIFSLSYIYPDLIFSLYTRLPHDENFPGLRYSRIHIHIQYTGVENRSGRDHRSPRAYIRTPRHLVLLASPSLLYICVRKVQLRVCIYIRKENCTGRFFTGSRRYIAYKENCKSFVGLFFLLACRSVVNHWRSRINQAHREDNASIYNRAK